MMLEVFQKRTGRIRKYVFGSLHLWYKENITIRFNSNFSWLIEKVE